VPLHYGAAVQPLDLAYIVIDVADLESVVPFWCDLLGVGVARRWRQYVMLEPASEGLPAFSFQQVAEPRLGKNRVHVDLHSDDPPGTVAEIERRGGGLLTTHTEDGVTVWVCADPEGNEFCLLARPVTSS
jgi:predicted enzyme related to lactoylglutathione lyase